MGVVIVIREVTANSRSVRHVRHGELDKDRWKYFYFCLVGGFFLGQSAAVNIIMFIKQVVRLNS